MHEWSVFPATIHCELWYTYLKKAECVALGAMGQSQVHVSKPAGSSPNDTGQGLPPNPKEEDPT